MLGETGADRRPRRETDMTALSPHLRQATPVVAVRGEGVHLHGEDGRRYLDFTAGIGVTSTGHCHPRPGPTPPPPPPRRCAGWSRSWARCPPPALTACSSPTPAARPWRPRCG